MSRVGRERSCMVRMGENRMVNGVGRDVVGKGCSVLGRGWKGNVRVYGGEKKVSMVDRGKSRSGSWGVGVAWWRKVSVVGERVLCLMMWWSLWW